MGYRYQKGPKKLTENGFGIGPSLGFSPVHLSNSFITSVLNTAWRLLKMDLGKKSLWGLSDKFTKMSDLTESKTN